MRRDSRRFSRYSRVRSNVAPPRKAGGDFRFFPVGNSGLSVALGVTINRRSVSIFVCLPDPPRTHSLAERESELDYRDHVTIAEPFPSCRPSWFTLDRRTLG